MQYSKNLLTDKSKFYSILEKMNNKIKEDKEIKNRSCPHCASTKVIKYGRVKSNNAQIFYCKECRKRFVESIGTPFYCSKKSNEVWDKYFENMWIGCTIRQCAKKGEISQNTAFFWRHKILSYYSKFIKRKTLEDEVEILVRTYAQNSKKIKESVVENFNKEIFELKKGERFYFFFTKDNNDNIGFLPFDKYPLVRSTLERNLLNILNEVKKVSIYGNNIIKSYVKRRFKEVSRIAEDSKLFFYERELKTWISGFWGVSFRYITNYLNWFKLYYDNNKEYKNTRQYMYRTIRKLILENVI